jgi:predicted nucleic acid-binding protein
MIPNELCLDANIFIAAMVPGEEDHDAALEVLRIVQENDIPLYEPAVAVFEVVSAFYRKTLLGELNPQESERLNDLFFQLPLLLQWQTSLMKKASKIAAELSFKRLYDCTYLAVASAREMPFVTLDAELAKKGRRIHGKVHSPASFLLSIT